jgi:hypothetical protein
MSEEKKSLKEAFEHVQKRRDIIRPNDGFIQQLLDYEKKLFNEQITVKDDLVLGHWGPKNRHHVKKNNEKKNEKNIKKN